METPQLDGGPPTFTVIPPTGASFSLPGKTHLVFVGFPFIVQVRVLCPQTIAVLPGARCLGADAARLAVQRHPAPSAASHAAPVAPATCSSQVIAISASSAKKLPQFATGRGAYIVLPGRWPAHVACSRPNHVRRGVNQPPHFEMEGDGNG